LVVGRRGLNRAQEVLLGSVSHACVHHSPVPVAIISH
jgi:nucleotide-binding universal stress UspA family protein